MPIRDFSCVTRLEVLAVTHRLRKLDAGVAAHDKRLPDIPGHFIVRLSDPE